MQISEINDRESLTTWLEDKPAEWAQTIAARVALRVAPLVWSVAALPDNALAEKHRKNLILFTFRASFISSAACKYQAEDMRSTAKASYTVDAAAYAATVMYDAQSSYHSARAVYASVRAAASPAAIYDAVDATHYANDAAKAATETTDYATAATIWTCTRADCFWLEDRETEWNERTYQDSDVAAALTAMPLWILQDDKGNLVSSRMPNDIAKAFETFQTSDLALDTSFGLITDWYQAILQGKSTFGKMADIAIAQMKPELWGDGDDDFDAIEVMDRVAEIAGWEREEQVDSEVAEKASHVLEVSEINNVEALREWLKDKPERWAQAIALRSALCVAPLSFDGIKFENHSRLIMLTNCIHVFRACYTALTYFNHGLGETAVVAAANAPATVGGNMTGRDEGISMLAGNSVFAAAASLVPRYDTSYVTSSTEWYMAASGHGTRPSAIDLVLDAVVIAARVEPEIWQAIQADCQWFLHLQKEGEVEASTPRSIFNLSLWMREVAPGQLVARPAPIRIAKAMNDFRGHALSQETSFGTIASWYDKIFSSPNSTFSPLGREADIALALQSSKFWESDPIKVMDHVAEILGWEQEEDSETLEVDSEPLESLAEILGETEAEEIKISIPATEPATLEPEWNNGRLVVPNRRVSDDFSGGDINAALLALRNLLASFGDALGNVANVDRRFLDYFQDLVEKAPTELPPQDQFFEFAHNELVLESYIITAQKEWDGVTSARFAAMAMQFSQTVEKVPAWRTFRKSTPTGELVSNDVNSAEELAEELAATLEEEPAQSFVAPEIPERIKEIANEIPEVLSPESGDRLVTPDVESRAFDLLESINNTLKKIIGAALWTKGKLSEVGAATWAPYSEGAIGEHKKQSKELGEWSVKWVFRLVKGGAALGTTTGLGWLATKYTWLGPVIEFFKTLVL